MFERAIAGFIAAAAFALGLAGADAQAQAARASKNLRIAMIDVEGGAAVLFVTPEGKSLLIDTGWPPGRGPARVPGIHPSESLLPSAERISAAAASLGVTKIDYLLVTHYHMDHVGGFEALLAKIPVGAFIDHGPNREQSTPDMDPRLLGFEPETSYARWQAAYAGHEHIRAEVGNTLDIGSMHLQFVTSDGKIPDTALPGAGQPNPLCAGVAPKEYNGGIENEKSVGTLITFGKTRILDLGDFSWNKEVELLCPTNKIGKVDVYMVDGHGMDLSSPPPTAAFTPIVALMQNGSTKGGDEAVLKTINTFPGLKGLWKSHYSTRYPSLNGDPNYIANLDTGPDQAFAINVGISPSGDITVTNARNHFSKTYRSRAK